MTNRVIVVTDPFDPKPHREEFEVDDHSAFLQARYGTHLPASVVLYHEHVAPIQNVTPRDPESLKRFLSLEGVVIAVEYPAEPTTIALIAVSILFVATLLVMKPPAPPVSRLRNSSSPSSNNDLSNRSNKARPNGRIPDIFGEAISVPDLLSLSYSTFIDNEEYEHSYLCIGRGEYDFPLKNGEPEIKDDTTLLSQIEGSSAEVYAPFNSPNGGSPQLTIGDPIGEKIFSIVRTEAVNGQSLLAPNDATFIASLQFLYPNIVRAPAGSTIDFTELYAVDDIVDMEGAFTNVNSTGYTTAFSLTTPGELTLTNTGALGGITFNDFDTGPVSAAGQWLRLSIPAQTVGGETVSISGVYFVTSDDIAGNMTLLDVGLYDTHWALLTGSPQTMVGVTAYLDGRNFESISLNGAYTIAAVLESEIELTGAGLVNQNWAYTYASGQTVPRTPSPGSTTSVTLGLGGSHSNWIGPIDVPLAGQTGFILNFVSGGGLYKDDGTTQTAFDVQLEIEYTPLSTGGSPLGPPRVYKRTIFGSATSQSQRALTVQPVQPISPAVNARFRARRVTPKDLAFTGQVVGDIQWKDLYVTAPLTQTNFGNVTTIQTLTRATKGALSIRNRKLNCRVIRKLHVVNTDGTRSFLTYPTKDIADIIAFVCTDPKIGASPDSQVDFVNLRATSDAVRAYFNRKSARQFCYTFDDDNTSFEETITAIATAAFCTPYRRGSVIKLFFEKLNNAPRLVFNHRNKIPQTETHTYTWGIEGGYDGVEYEWIDPSDGSPATIYLPADRSATKAKTIESLGVRNYIQANLHAQRAWNRLQYQRELVEFTALRESDLLVRNDKVLISDNTRSKTQDGDIVSKTSLVIETSAPVVFEDGVDYVVFLQADDGTVESIGATAGANEYEITLATEPTGTLSLNPANVTLSKYILVAEAKSESLGYLVTDRTVENPQQSKLQAINYDARYYQGDKQYSGRVAHYYEGTDVSLYDDADETLRDIAGFYAEDNFLIPTVDDPAYSYDEEDGEADSD